MDDSSDLKLKNIFFDLTLTSYDNKTLIDLRLRQNFILTNSLPATSEVLNSTLPSIFQHLCFNPKGLPFKQEVINTEFGHLFEHILIEYLQLNSSQQAIYEGETRWNWQREPKGQFHIEINVSLDEKELLLQMLDKTIFLINQIIYSSQILTSQVVTPDS